MRKINHLITHLSYSLNSSSSSLHNGRHLDLGRDSVLDREHEYHFACDLNDSEVDPPYDLDEDTTSELDDDPDTDTRRDSINSEKKQGNLTMLPCC